MTEGERGRGVGETEGYLPTFQADVEDRVLIRLLSTAMEENVRISKARKILLRSLHCILLRSARVDNSQ